MRGSEFDSIVIEQARQLTAYVNGRCEVENQDLCGIEITHRALDLRRSGKPVLVAVNKVDTHRAEPNVSEFHQLGFEKVFPVTAIHGDGIEARRLHDR